MKQTLALVLLALLLAALAAGCAPAPALPDSTPQIALPQNYNPAESETLTDAEAVEYYSNLCAELETTYAFSGEWDPEIIDFYLQDGSGFSLQPSYENGSSRSFSPISLDGSAMVFCLYEDYEKDIGELFYVALEGDTTPVASGVTQYHFARGSKTLYYVSASVLYRYTAQSGGTSLAKGCTSFAASANEQHILYAGGNGLTLLSNGSHTQVYAYQEGLTPIAVANDGNTAFFYVPDSDTYSRGRVVVYALDLATGQEHSIGNIKKETSNMYGRDGRFFTNYAGDELMVDCEYTLHRYTPKTGFEQLLDDEYHTFLYGAQVLHRQEAATLLQNNFNSVVFRNNYYQLNIHFNGAVHPLGDAKVYEIGRESDVVTFLKAVPARPKQASVQSGGFVQRNISFASCIALRASYNGNVVYLVSKQKRLLVSVGGAAPTTIGSDVRIEQYPEWTSSIAISPGGEYCIYTQNQGQKNGNWVATNACLYTLGGKSVTLEKKAFTPAVSAVSPSGRYSMLAANGGAHQGGEAYYSVFGNIYFYEQDTLVTQVENTYFFDPNPAYMI